MRTPENRTQRSIRARLQVRIDRLQAELEAEANRLQNVSVEDAILQQKQASILSAMLGC